MNLNIKRIFKRIFFVIVVRFIVWIWVLLLIYYAYNAFFETGE
jgi:hypothetical protein